MTSYSRELLDQTYDGIPECLKDAMYSVYIANTMIDIGKKYDLDVRTTVGVMSEETGFIFLGLTHPADFVATLADRLAISEGKARHIAEAIRRRVLVRYHNVLLVTYHFDVCDIERSGMHPSRASVLSSSR